MKTATFSGFVISAALGLLLAATPTAAKDTARVDPKHKTTQNVDAHPVGTVPEDISPEAAEVVWLFHHGLENYKLLDYVNRSHQEFKLSVEDVNYLKDIGVPTDVVFAMIRTPQARENIVRLRNHEPIWRVKNTNPKQEEPQPALENIDFRRTQQLDNSDNNPVPQYYGPANVPEHPPRGVPPPNNPYGVLPPNNNNFNDHVLRPGDPGYNGPNANGQPTVPNGQPIIP